MVIRAKTKSLFVGKPLTAMQRQNSELNVRELESGELVLKSKPRRIVLELTNACNLNCLMCGRNATEFKPTQLDMEYFFSLEPLFDMVEEVTLMGWGEPTFHPQFAEMLRVLAKHSARIYFCTNGMQLDKIHRAIFNYDVEVFAVSIDGANQDTNGAIRRGSDLDVINNSLRKIVAEKRSNHLIYPYINYVFCVMKRNLNELPNVVEMAADIGLEEVKVVFLTAFSEEFVDETLFDEEAKVKNIFEIATRRAEELGVLLKLPYIQGADPAETALHRDCFVAHRDFFLGSDGYVRPCMSTAEKFFRYNKRQPFEDIWNAPEYQRHRKFVNTCDMSIYCKNCYQSSHCNWNNKKSYIQVDEDFAPEWEA